MSRPGYFSMPACFFTAALALLIWQAALPLPPALGKNTAGITAEELFSQLPATIFENTAEPLDEEGKEHLLARGRTRTWTIISNTADEMRMVSVKDAATKVSVRVLRAPSGGVVVLGAETGDSCASELWGYNASGGIVPLPGPQEPGPSEFFTPRHGFPPGVVPSYRLCLEKEALEAKPLFWNDDGLVDITPDNRIFFHWNGSSFVKDVAPVSAQTAAPTAAANQPEGTARAIESPARAAPAGTTPEQPAPPLSPAGAATGSQ